MFAQRKSLKSPKSNEEHLEKIWEDSLQIWVNKAIGIWQADWRWSFSVDNTTRLSLVCLFQAREETIISASA